ncbi:MAG: basic amino acid/polyamine antiporter [Bacteroides sp.]|nr:basic amino acid/polyamine antiporter [Bacteroides sp.]MCM1457229.1 basic amino acid/polyamine antiporter [Lachnoclostridium sp.]
MTGSTKKLGLMGLTAIVFSSIIGGGIYNIAQNMASHAGLGAVILSWVITAIGMIFLVYSFKILSDTRPDLNAGIYQYAQAGFGNYTGFLVAWGYWLCTCTGNVAYAVMLNDSVGAFFPVFLKHGWQTVAFGSALIWLMYFIVVNGLKTASFLNVLITGIQMLSLAVIVGILVIFAKMDMLSFDFWGQVTDLGSVGGQVKTTMLVTLWCFTGIEGAVMMSSRARKSSDVGKAGIIGFICAWFIYALVSVLSFGIMKQAQLAGLPDPSVAYVLKAACGEWAYCLVLVTVMVSITGGWIAWTLVCAQVPYEAANVKIFPKKFLSLNKKQMPAFGLLVSTVVMQVFMLLVVTSKEVYTAALDLTSIMVLPAYLFTGIYLWKASRNGSLAQSGILARKQNFYTFIGVGATVFCSYIVLSSNWMFILVSTIFYFPGTFFYIKARKEQGVGKTVFTAGEKWLCGIVSACALVGVVLLVTGHAGI